MMMMEGAPSVGGPLAGSDLSNGVVGTFCDYSTRVSIQNIEVCSAMSHRGQPLKPLWSEPDDCENQFPANAFSAVDFVFLGACRICKCCSEKQKCGMPAFMPPGWTKVSILPSIDWVREWLLQLPVWAELLLPAEMLLTESCLLPLQIKQVHVLLSSVLHEWE